ncbi:MAG TPA: FAD-linked oxidase C-terminal domain-containing protein [Pyrinomonadaceae bacterium]|nr:FAD-linked oxidase C-terminal domain-containing protein [Pyrinomonadaceae bacterium]
MDPLIHNLRSILGPDGVLSESDELLVYECDGLPQHKYRPRAVVFPRSTDQVAAAVKELVRAGVPFAPRGAGTGLSGGALARDRGVIIELARMKRLLDVDAANFRATVEVGVVNSHLSRVVAPLGLYYVPDPSSQATCTIGGNIAENAGGIHCLKYGMTVDHVLAARVVLGDGEIVTLDAGAPGYDLLGLFIGSEGTFGIATEAVLKLTPIPPAVRTLLADFTDLDQASRAVSEIIAAGFVPAALEMMDGATIRAVEASVFAAGMPTDAEAALLIELDGLAAGLDEEAERAAALCRAHGARSVRIASAEVDRKKLWAARKGAFGAMGRISPDIMLQDAVVPRSRLPEVLAEITRIAARYQLTLANVFHAGDGNLHPYICYDARDSDQVRRMKEAGREMMEECVRVGGTITGEHGVGLDKSEYLPLIFSPDDLDVMLRVRRAFDPLGLCNPGKVLPTPRTCGEARGVTTRQNGEAQVSPVIDQGNFAAATRVPVMPIAAPIAPGSASPPPTKSRKIAGGKTPGVFQQLQRLVPQAHVVNDEGEGAPVTVAPSSIVEIREVLRLARSENWSMLPVGGGSWSRVGNVRPRPDLQISTVNLPAAIEHEPADLVASAGAGTTLAAFNEELGRANQWLPLDSPVDDEGQRPTLGGIAATGLGGAQSFAYGLPRNHLIGMRFMLADGRVIKAGGRVVKNVAGYDLCKLLTGSYGTLGLITELIFKLRPRPASETTVVVRGASVGALADFGRAVIARQLLPVAAELFSPGALPTSAGGDEHQSSLLIRFAGSRETVAAQVEEISRLAKDFPAVNCAAVVAEDASLWSAVASTPHAEPGCLSFRARVVPANVSKLFESLAGFQSETKCIVRWHIGLGDGWLRAAGEDFHPSPAGDAALRKLRQTAGQLGGSLVLEQASDETKANVGVWGESARNTLSLMRRLKDQLDPDHLFNPNCFDF